MFKKKLKYLIFYFILLHATLIQANDKIVYLDMNYILNNSLAGKSITTQLNKKNKKNLDLFKQKEKNLKSEQDKLLTQKNVLDEEEYKKKIILFKEKIANFNNERKISIKTFNKKKKDAEATLINTLTPILAEFAKKDKIEIILDKKNIIMGKNELDITQVILKTLDTKIKNINIK